MKRHDIHRVLIGGMAALSLLSVLWWVHSGSALRRALIHHADFRPFADGTLLRAEGTEHVFYIEDGMKRWIDSAETFRAQDLSFERVMTVPASHLRQYPDGDPVTARTPLVLPDERRVMPDIAPLAPYDLRLGTESGRTVIRFTGSFWNGGMQPFDLRTDPGQASGVQETTEDVYQQVAAEDGTVRRKFVGTFVFHPAHDHHHYDDFAEYIIQPVRLDSGEPLFAARSYRHKTTFCFRDDERFAGELQAVEVPVFTACDGTRQGLSPGWVDVYPYTLPDQYVDVHDLPPGIYALSFHVDPNRRFIEASTDNNIGTTFISLNVQTRTLRVLGHMSPFAHPRNGYEPGTLVRTQEDGSVYLLGSGGRRWIRSVDIFNSYGYSWYGIYPVTRAMLMAVPPQSLVRHAGTSEIYILNEHGYRRHIRSPEIFASYGLSYDAVADINELDFAFYREGSLVLVVGDDTVYRVEGQTARALGRFGDLQNDGADLRAMHVITPEDFASLTTVL